jgi:hypothetical protein
MTRLTLTGCTGILLDKLRKSPAFTGIRRLITGDLKLLTTAHKIKKPTSDAPSNI